MGVPIGSLADTIASMVDSWSDVALLSLNTMVCILINYLGVGAYHHIVVWHMTADVFVDKWLALLNYLLDGLGLYHSLLNWLLLLIYYVRCSWGLTVVEL